MPTAQLLSSAELADALAVSVDTVHRMSEAGELPAFRVGRQWRYDLDACRAALATSTAPPPADGDPIERFLASPAWRRATAGADTGSTVRFGDQLQDEQLLAGAPDMWHTAATVSGIEGREVLGPVARRPRPSLVQLVETIPFDGLKVRTLTETTAAGHFARGRAIGETLPQTTLVVAEDPVDPVDFGTITEAPARLLGRSGAGARRFLSRVLREDVMEGLSWEIVNGDGTTEVEGTETTTHLEGLALAGVTEHARTTEENRDALITAAASVQDAGYVDGPIVAVTTPEAILDMALERDATNGQYVNDELDPIDLYLPSTAIPAGEAYVGSWFDAIALHMHEAGVRLGFFDQDATNVRELLVTVRTFATVHLHVRAPEALRHVTGLTETATV